MQVTKYNQRNGSVTAHSREWPLYERFEHGLMILFMSPEDRAEKERLDQESLNQWKSRNWN